MPQRTLEVSPEVFGIMLLGDFFGLVFLFYFIFWLCDNTRACKRRVENVDQYIRRKSSSIVTRWSVKGKDDGFSSKESNLEHLHLSWIFMLRPFFVHNQASRETVSSQPVL